MRRAFLLALAIGALTHRAEAQELVEQYKHNRLRSVSEQVMARRGLFLTPRPPAHLPTRSDTLAAWLASLQPTDPVPEMPPPPEPLAIDSIKVFSRLERIVFANRHRETRWAFQQGRRLEPVDTTRTLEMRARLEAHFGAPTMTLVELDSLRGRSAEEIIQFEYWMVLNDSIPAMIIDVNGPLGRGVVVATSAEFRGELDAIRYGLLQRLFDEERLAPFVDYYYQTETRAWWVSGYDGATFFHRRIDPPGLPLTRPRLSEYATGASDR